MSRNFNEHFHKIITIISCEIITNKFRENITKKVLWFFLLRKTKNFREIITKNFWEILRIRFSRNQCYGTLSSKCRIHFHSWSEKGYRKPRQQERACSLRCILFSFFVFSTINQRKFQERESGNNLHFFFCFFNIYINIFLKFFYNYL